MDLPCAPTRGYRRCVIAADAVGKQEFDGLLVDLNHVRGKTSGEEGVDLLTRSQAEYPTLTVVVMTARVSVEGAVEAHPARRPGLRRGVREAS